MAFLGLVSQKEYNKLRQEIETFKANFAPYENWQLETARAEEYNLPDPSVFANQADLYRHVSSIFTAVDIVSSCGALTDFEVARLIVGKEPKDIPGHDFENLLRQPNPLDSRYEFLYATIAYFMLSRNSYWWLNRRDEFSPPDEMWVIPPHMIIPVPDERLFLRGYLYYPGTGVEIFLQPHEICHFRGFNPFSRFIGLPAAIESLMTIAQAYLGMVSWQTKLYKKSSARLPGILSFEQMIADPTWEKIKADTNEAAQNRNLLMLRGVGQGVNWQQASANQREMQYFEGLDAIDKKIMDTLAPGAYTMLFENATEANSRTGRATLNELAIYPKHVMIGETVTNKILPAYPGRPLIGHFEDIRITDRQLELSEQVEFSKAHTFAEIREKYYGDDPFGDDRDDLIPEQLKNYKDPVQQKIELEKQKLSMANSQAKNNQPAAQLQAATNAPPQMDNMPPPVNGQKMEALGKFERFALRQIGKALKFQNDLLSEQLISEIAAKFASCKTEEDVKMLFRAYKTRVQGEAAHDQNALKMLADSINAAVILAQLQEKERNRDNQLWDAIKGMNSTTTQPQNIYLSPAIHMPPNAPQNISLTLPANGETVNYYTMPAVEAAKAPDVNIDSPVNIYQTIEPAPTPVTNIEAPITITNEAQPAPVVNFAPQINVPEQAAPDITVTPVFQSPDISVKVDPAQVTVNVPEQPAPNVTVTNEIKTPKVKRTKSKVERDDKDNIGGQTTDFEYEDE